MSSNEHPPQSGAPRSGSFFLRLAALVVEVVVAQLLFVGLMQLIPGFVTGAWSSGNHPLPLLILAVVRIVCESAWGSSLGKYLANLRVVFHTRTGGEVASLARMPRAVLRNGWLWLPAVMSLINPEGDWYSGLASLVALSALIRRDGRSLADLLAGAQVFPTKHTTPRRAPDGTSWPTSAPPQRALAWAVDMGVSAAVGVGLAVATGWGFWPTALTVLGALRLVTEWVGIPTPGKAVMGLRVYYLAWFDLRALVFVQVLIRNLWIPVAIAYATASYATPLLAEGIVMFFILVFPDHRGVMDWLSGAHVTDVRGSQEM